MESLSSLKERLSSAEEELRKITKSKRGAVPWAHGVQDQYETQMYSYEEYTDDKKASWLKREIKELREQIDTYAQRVAAEREREEIIKEGRIPKYKYSVAGKVEETKNPAIAARYDAQQRFFGMSKLRRAVSILNGQKKKFYKLWDKAQTANKEEQVKVATELNDMFRSK